MEMKMKTWRCQKFWEHLEKVGKTFFQSIGAKKSKIVDKMQTRGFEEGWSKNSFG
jgi:hypothetical protein